jgi:hypothetical protein
MVTYFDTGNDLLWSERVGMSSPPVLFYVEYEQNQVDYGQNRSRHHSPILKTHVPDNESARVYPECNESHCKL